MRATEVLPCDTVPLFVTPAMIGAADLAHHYARGLYPLSGPGLGQLVWCAYSPPAGAQVAGLRVPRRLRKTVRRRPYAVTADTAFDRVVAACADTERAGNWIDRDIQAVAGRLHACGLAHSLEVWSHDTLVGGLYGLALGGVFIGESMFTRADNAGAVAMTHLCARLYEGGFGFLDTQMAGPHTQRFGVHQMAAAEFRDQRTHALQLEASFGPGGPDDITRVERFLQAAAGR